MWTKEISVLERSLLTTAIGTIFNNETQWMEFLFSHKAPELRLPPEDLIGEAACFSRGEQIKIRVALDLWTGLGNASIADVVEGLDYNSFLCVVRSILILREVCLGDLEDFRSRYEDEV